MKYLLYILTILFFCESDIYSQSKKRKSKKAKVTKNSAIDPNANSNDISVLQFGVKGDGVSNDHDGFMKAAEYINQRGGNCKLVIPKGKYIIGKQLQNSTYLFTGLHALELSNCQNVTIDGKGAEIIFKDNLYFGSFDPVTKLKFDGAGSVFADPKYAATGGSFLLLKNCDHIQLLNLEVDGNCDKAIVGGRYGDVGIQLPYIGVFAIYCTNLLVQNCSFHHFGQDGMMLKNNTPQGEATPNSNVQLINSHFDHNGRQGFSWCGGVGLKAINCSFSHTGDGKIQSAPGAGCDIEAEETFIKQGVFNDCIFENNYGVGLVADSGPSRDVQFNNCTFWGNRNWSNWCNKPSFTYSNCNFYGCSVHAFDAKTADEATKYLHCNFEDKLYKGQKVFGDFVFMVNQKKRLQLIDCTFTSNYSKLFWYDGIAAYSNAEKPLVKNCRFILNNNTMIPKLEYALVLTACNIQDNQFQIKNKKVGFVKNNFYLSANTDLGNNTNDF
jgi:Right handed beta helix region